MFVVAINDCGEERDFLATALEYVGLDIVVTVSGTRLRFPEGDVIAVVPVCLRQTRTRNRS